MHTIRFLFTFCLMMFVILPPAHAAYFSCEDLFLTSKHTQLAVIRLELDQKVASLPKLARLKYLFLKKKIQKKVLARCSDTGCSGKEIQTFVRDEMDTLATNNLSTKLKGFGILSSSIFGISWLTAHMNSALPEEFQFATQVAGLVTGLYVYQLVSPMIDPELSLFRKKAFKVRATRDLAELSPVPEMDAYWIELQARYSLNAQVILNRLMDLKKSVQTGLNDLRRAVENNELQLAAEYLASEAMIIRSFFGEFDPDFPWITKFVQTRLPQSILNNPSFKALVMTELQRIEPIILTDTRIQSYYNTMLDHWLSDLPDTK